MEREVIDYILSSNDAAFIYQCYYPSIRQLINWHRYYPVSAPNDTFINAIFRIKPATEPLQVRLAKRIKLGSDARI